MRKLYLSSLLMTLGFFGFSQTTTFNFTGSVQTYTVPSGVTSLLIDMQGAKGGDNNNWPSGTYPSQGGNGGRVQAVLAVTPGQVLNIFVGGQGAVGTTSADPAGGFNGGGAGGTDFSSYAGGGGGGATDIRIGSTDLSSIVLVAGGGGGAGLDNSGGNMELGGAGGGLTGGNGYWDGSNTAGEGGYGGTQSAGGASGSGAGSAGTLAIGGDAYSSGASGGGGGGYYGGGGGGSAWSAGGGGSSYTDPILATAVVHTQAYNSSDGVCILTPLSPCSGTPVAGSTVVSPSAGGSSTIFTLSLSGATIASGLSYTWQSSPDGTTWSTIPGATSSSYSFTGISANTYYQCIISCTASSASATSTSAMASYVVLPTCDPTSTSWAFESGEVIYGGDALFVTGYLGTNINDAGLTSSANPTTGYLDHTALTPVQFQQNGVYASSLTWGISSSHQYLQTWIDFNDDGTFAASEEVSPVSGYPSSQPTIFNITIPLTANPGTHLMRVRAIWEYNLTDIGSAPAHCDPCLIEYGGSYPEYYSGDVIDYLATIVPLPPCTGTPDGGTATSSTTSLCPSASFTLNYTGAGASGLTFQWQSSTDGITYSNIPGATTVPYTTTESVTTYYQLVITCTGSGLSATSIPVMVIQLPYCYCVPTYYYSSPSAFDALSDFYLAGFSGSTISDPGPSTAPSSGYIDESSTVTVNLQQGGVYSGSITYNTDWEEYEDQVWIDFNDNGTFETSEEVTPDFGVTGCSGTGTSATFSLSIPLTAPTGNHRMRIRQAETYNCTPETDMDPCNSVSSFTGDYYYYGETRDYTADIIALPPCSGTPTGGTAVVTPSIGGIGTTFTLSLSGATSASGLTYDWQSSTDGTTWSDIPGATAATYTFTGISVNMYYQCIITCTASSSSATSASVMATYALTPTCYPTSSSWAYESGEVIYGGDALYVNGYGSTNINDFGMTSSANPSTGYLDRTALTPVQFQQSGIYASSLTWGISSSHQYLQTWIDFNNNGTFETSEEVSPVSGYPASQPTVFNVSIPLTADTGLHLMRVRAIWEYNFTDIGSAPPHVDPCLFEFGGIYPEYYSGDVIDYMAYIVPLPPCSGTPSAGTATSSITAVCPSGTFDLNYTGTPAAGLTYQWQSSTDGLTWTDISGATTVPYTATESVSTYFHLNLTCTASGLSATTDSVLVAYLPYCYCIPSYYYSSPSAFDALSSFDLTGYLGSSISDAGPSTPPSSGFEDETATDTINLQQAGIYSGTITYNTYWEEYEDQVWIDFNDNGTFETSEEVTPDFGVTGCSGTGISASFTLTIPSTAPAGLHRMRVRQAETYNCTPETDMDPCNSVSVYSGDYYYYGNARDYMANIIALPVCSGAPVAGSATSTVTLACPSLSIVLNTTGAPATGLTYDWQSSTDSVTWSDISGGTTLPFTTTESVATYYRCIVTCTGSGLSDTSTMVFVNYMSACYCTPSYYYSSPATFDALSNFSLTGYAGTSIDDAGPSTPPTSGYEDETATISIQLQQNGSYPGTITYNTYWEEYEDQVWIDFNDNGAFETSEEVTPDFGVTGCATTGISASYTLTIPLTANPGWHRMRVRQAETYNCTPETDMDPCNYISSFSGDYYYYGCTRDYMAEIIPLPVCTGTPSAGVVSATDTTGCTSYSSVLTDTGSSIATGLTYQWQSSPDGTTWTNVGGAVTTTFTATVTAPTYYRFSIYCTATGMTGYSSAVFLDMTPNPAPISLSTGGAPGGPFALCYTTTGATFSGGATGGTWANTATGVGSVDPSSGLWTSTGSTGTTTISYTIATCTATATLNINSVAPATPTLSTGTNPMCAYSMLSLGDATTGGVWSSASTAIATVDGSGNVTGTGYGTTMISYNNGCGAATYPVTINGTGITLSPASGQICNGVDATLTATLLTDPGVSYSWSGPSGSSTSTALTISAASTADAGVYTFTTTTSSTSGGCVETVMLPVVIMPTPSLTVTPSTASVCVGSGLSVATTSVLTPPAVQLLAQNFNSGMTGQVGGTWSVVNTGDASSYNWSILAPYYWYDITIAGDGSNYIGTNADEAGGSVTLNTFLISPSFSTVGYTAASLNFNHYVYSSTFYDLNAEIDYSIDGGTTWTLLQNYLGMTDGATSWVAGTPTHSLSLPSAALGQPNVMLQWHYYSNFGFYWAVDNIEVDGAAAPTTFSWAGSSGTTGIACPVCPSTTITPSTSGASVYTLTATTGVCSATATESITTYPTPTAITGIASICAGSTTTLADSVSGGTWSSSDVTIATVDPVTGIVSGVATGSATITYMVGTCTATMIVNVGTSGPSAITGILAVCGGATTTLSDSISGGTWVSGSTGIASVNPVTGVVTGLSGGSAVISYTTGCGAPATITVSVTPGPASIAGATSECVGSSVTLTDATSGGSWSASSGSIVATGSSSGIVLGLTPGVVTITYSVGCGQSTSSFTVNGAPAMPGGASSVCVAGTASVTDATVGGAWTSNNMGIATVVSGTGLVTGVAAGVDTIVYTTTCGTSWSTITVNAAPVAITGVTSLCAGGSTTLADATAGGTWSCGTPGVASIDPVAGAVSGLAPGVAAITYTTSCGMATTSVTVNSSLPASISGSSSLCQGSSITLSDATLGGSWSSSATGVATVTSGGLVMGVAGGVTTISYSTGCGAPSTMAVTINPSPSVITGMTGFCSGSTTTLFDSVSGGSWTSGNPAVASIDPVTGIVSGSGSGVVAITYANSCGSAYTTVTVNTATPAAISGASSVCVGSTITLTDATTGGDWSSSAVGTAGIGATTGIVSGVIAGTVTISYTTGCGAPVVKNITVNPVPGAISGSSSVCVSGTATLADIVSGGTWTSSSTGVAGVGSTTGVVSGAMAGTATITYTTASCGSVTMPITVTAGPASISGAAAMCIGGTSILSDATAGGTWSSSNTAVVTVDPSLGIASGASSGTATITYTTTCGMSLLPVTVNGAPASISGSSSLCIGTVETLTDPSTGGTWLSDASTVASVDATSGILTGVGGGVAIITFSNGCGTATETVTVNSSIAITGPSSICMSSTASFTDASSGGTWSSSDPTVATVDPVTGVVTSVALGSTVIMYNSGLLCGSASATVNVVGAPAPITGAGSICSGSTLSLSNTTTGGTWTSGSTSVASVDPTSGVITGGSAGVVTISYSTGCLAPAVATITVNGSPMAIAGVLTTCVTGATSLSDASTGGTWTSGNTSVATIDPVSGVATGIAAGVSVITYANGCGAPVMATLTVNGAPSSIVGSSIVLSGCTITLTDPTMGGTWSSSDITTATVDPATGIVGGVTLGSAVITYATTCGIATAVVSVNSAAPAIVGSNTLCAGGTVSLSDAVSGGTWSSTATGIASITSTGVVTGVAAGVAIISYSGACGINVALMVTVNAAVPAISGFSSLCQYSTTTLTDGASGTWSSSNTSIATVDPVLGTVVATGFGVDTITINAGIGCSTMKAITVNAYPNAGVISGADSVCASGMITLVDTFGGGSGTWASSSSAVATVSGGVVTATGMGSVVISYSVSNLCGTANATKTIGVRALAVAGSITGSVNFCAGANTTLTDSITGGVWSMSNATVASVINGVVSGLMVGTDTAVYTVTNACGSATTTLAVFVRGLPVPITGATSVCVGSPAVVYDSALSGTWSSSDLGTALVDSITGVVTGVGVGPVTISYSGCGATVTTTITVNAAPDAGVISLSDSMVCAGASINAFNTVTGGTWSLSNGSASLDTSIGAVITGMSSGVDTLVYAVTSPSCGIRLAIASLTVNPLPNAGILTGSDSVCVNASAMITATSTGGSWSVSNANAIDTNGIVYGIMAGTDSVMYTVSTAFCGSATASMLVTVLPLPSAGMISGSAVVCQATPVTFTDAVTGGTWSMNFGTGSASVTSGGVVTGTGNGPDTVVYTVMNSCGSASATMAIMINSLPATGTITGSDTICIGTTSSLSESASGGTWSSLHTTVAMISSGGLVTGVAPGTDSIYYALSNVCGSDSALVGILVMPRPDSNLIIDTTICSGTMVMVSDTALGFTGSWVSTNPAIATVSGGMITAVGQGTDTVAYIVATYCGASLGAAIINVDSLPVVGSITGNSFICQGGRDHFDTLSSTTSGGIWSSSNATNTITPSSGILAGNVTGPDTVTYTVTNGVCAASASKIIQIYTAWQCDSILVVGTVNKEDGLIKVYPNPNAGSFVVELPDATINSSIVIMDIYGKIVKTIEVNDHTTRLVPFDLSNLARGTYMIKVTQGDNTYRGKVLIVE